MYVCMYVCMFAFLFVFVFVFVFVFEYMYGYLLVLLYMRFLHHMVILNSDQVMCSNSFLKKNTTWPYSVFLQETITVHYQIILSSLYCYLETLSTPHTCHRLYVLLLSCLYVHIFVTYCTDSCSCSCVCVYGIFHSIFFHYHN